MLRRILMSVALVFGVSLLSVQAQTTKTEAAVIIYQGPANSAGYGHRRGRCYSHHHGYKGWHRHCKRRAWRWGHRHFHWKWRYGHRVKVWHRHKIY